MSSEGTTKIDLQKQPPNKVSGGAESELDKEDFQQAATNAKEAVSNGLNNAKEFMTGESNDAANKTSQGSDGLDSLQSLSDGVIANELDSIHGHQDAAHGTSQATSSDKGVVENAKDQTASALKYAEDQLRQKSDKEDPEIQDFKNAVADTAEDTKKSVQSTDTKSTDTKTTGSEKTVLEQVQDAASAVYNKIVPSAEAKEPSDSEARRHLNRAGDAAKDAGEDLKTSAYEVKEALKDTARGYGNTLQDRANRYGDEARSVSPADQQTDDVREDLDRYRTRAGDKAYRAADQAGQKYDDAKQQGRETYDEAKQKGRGIWGGVKDFFGGGADRANEAGDYAREQGYRAQDRASRAADNYPSGDQIRREGRASWENAKEATKDTGRYLAGRAGAAVDGVDRRTEQGYNSYDRTRDSARETKEDAKDTLANARDSVKDSYYDTKRSAKNSYYETKHDVQDRLNDTKDSIKDSYNETKDSIRHSYNETNREINETIDNAKRSWRESMTPDNYFEAAWSKGEIPSNTEDILRSRGVYDGPGSPRLGNQDSRSQAHIESKNMSGEDFLRQTEYGYGEENLGGDDLSDLRAAADGHGPFAKYK